MKLLEDPISCTCFGVDLGVGADMNGLMGAFWAVFSSRWPIVPSAQTDTTRSLLNWKDIVHFNSLCILLGTCKRMYIHVMVVRVYDVMFGCHFRIKRLILQKYNCCLAGKFLRYVFWFQRLRFWEYWCAQKNWNCFCVVVLKSKRIFPLNGPTKELTTRSSWSF